MKKLLIMLLFLPLFILSNDFKDKDPNKEKQQNIIGFVVDKETKEHLAGVQLKIETENKTFFTYTDLDGKFEFDNIESEYKININFISYSDTIINIKDPINSNNITIPIKQL